ncbi:hypothetical protein SmaMPs15_000038 [Stenotrophomonas maltophilia phage vB_SmaM_Ps15]|uniref:Uncharacterized protein n=1 Tax=Stenotrophomonas maltophilia phage vB_SmaM_Ps15 TaxID=3071007 RepID=A0AAE9FM19_9CAUD|nr:hypothetical protein PQC01_gp038 [Stenotrophomonas maltophilia phage vB_SmaM_Ps15]UMO77189.1 hypothetical protein SmaMPs15_000038 [Stenotrophomonas maltophilia phage vB_SmaM_Ps15]
MKSFITSDEIAQLPKYIFADLIVAKDTTMRLYLTYGTPKMPGNLYLDLTNVAPDLWEYEVPDYIALLLKDETGAEKLTKCIHLLFNTV